MGPKPATLLFTLFLLAGLAMPLGADSLPAYAQLVERMASRYNADDATGLAALWTRDALMRFPEKEASGRDAIQALYQDQIERIRASGSDRRLEVKAREWWKDRGAGLTWGEYRVLVDDAVVEEGTFILRAEFRGGRWLIHRLWVAPGSPR